METRPERARARVVRRHALDHATREAMWRLYTSYYDGVSAPSFHADLDEKSHVILLRRASGGLVGFSTITTHRVRQGDRTIRILFSGDTILARAYWGDRSLQHAFGRFMTRYRLRHPLSPMYWFLISKGYKTYLLLSRNFPEHWPRHDRETPDPMRALLAALAAERFGPRWDASRGIVRADGDSPRLKGGVAPVPTDQQVSDDIRFFLGRNPHHAAGEELACLGRITIGLWFRYGWRKMRHARRPGVARPRAVAGEETG